MTNHELHGIKWFYFCLGMLAGGAVCFFGYLVAHQGAA